MKTKTILGICLSLCVWSFAGCGDDEAIDIFPEGTASLRMMNEDNGKTLLGNSDVYITNAGNFTSDQYPLFDVGEKRGIGDIDMPGFANMAPEVAVQPRHGYVICEANDVRTFPSGKKAIREDASVYRVFVDSWIDRTFPSGKKAIREDASVYRVFVDSWIEDKEGNATGANVYFLLGKPDTDEGIPLWHSEIGWQYDITKGNPLELTLPSDDIEVEILSEQENYNYLAYSMRGRTLVFRIEKDTGMDAVYQVRIRCQNIYTEVSLSLKNIW